MAKPFLKWAGGKAWFAANEGNRIPQNYDRYIEPFLGGASMFFSINPQNAILSDINQELINTYNALRENFNLVYRNLKKHETNNSQEYYYKIRKTKPRTQPSAAARMIYLNKTCFNGIYRTNGNGNFNVPYGTDKQISFDKQELLDASNSLQHATLLCQDFEYTVNLAQENDFLFCDPPYVVPTSTNKFNLYNAVSFSWDDQIRLARLLHAAANRGVKIILTNIEHPSVRELYNDELRFQLDTISRKCTISGVAEGRKDFQELVISANIN